MDENDRYTKSGWYKPTVLEWIQLVLILAVCIFSILNFYK